MIFAGLLSALGMKAQSYESLWRLVDEAQDKDLPQTAMSHLQKIEQKAKKEQAYGQLLKSALLNAKLQAEVAPDSLTPAVSRLEQQEQATKDLALKAVYDVVLWKIYSNNYELKDNRDKHLKDYRLGAMEHPELLAQTKAEGYVPFVMKEKDSELFGHDLLSIIGMELGEWQWLTDYYTKAGNRKAACLTAVETAKTIADVDSLIRVYGDLPEAGELAVRRYQLMSGNRYSAAEKDAWLNSALQRWGSWKRANELKNEKTALNNPYYQLRIAQPVMETGKAQMIYITEMRNIQQLTMRIYRTTLDGETNLNPENAQDYKKMKDGLQELKEQQRMLTFSGHASYDIFKDSVQINGLPAGVYLVEFSSEQQTRTTRMLYFVSDLRIIMQGQPGEQKRYVVVNATTGQPVAGAMLRLRFSNNREKTTILTCDQQGEVLYNYGRQFPSSVFAYTNTDNSSPKVGSYGSYSYYEHHYDNEHTTLLTDRSIYRPGQTVHVTAILWKELSATDNIAVSDRQMTLSLRDANYRLIAEQHVLTDRFGKASAQFTLPTGQLNGRFSIQSATSSAFFQVEEYKRPTFQVEFADYKSSYQHGDTIQVEGKATTYAGVPVQGGKVKYKVKRRIAFWWLSYSRYWGYGYAGHGNQDEVLHEGETTTEDDGTFCVDMPMVLPDNSSSHTMFYHFIAEAEVTDLGGETHQGTISLPLGNKATALTCTLPDQVRSDQLKDFTFNRYNAAGKEIAGTVKYRIDGKKWNECEANSQCSMLNAQLKSGEHRLEAICEKDTLDRTFVVFGLDDKKPATKTKDWWYVSETQFSNDGQPITIQVGSSDPDLHIIYSIFAGDKLIESGTEKRSDALVNRKFTYKEEYGNGLLVTYAWVKDGQCYRHQTFIRRPMPDKRLKLSWETFRDRLTPGQQEEWRLTIKKPDGTPAEASLAAVLYDKSLDAIKSHQWSFAPTNYLAQPSTSWMWRTWSGVSLSASKSSKYLNVPSFAYSSFDDSVFPVYIHPVLLGAGVRVRGTNFLTKTSAAVVDSAPAGEALEAQRESAVMEEKNAVADTAEQQEERTSTQEVSVRENLNETAFCYPTLETNQDGLVTMKFTLPESLTTWRFMGVANTADMLYGSIEGEAIAQKDVMIQPNMPRFLRIGDDATITARIFNTSEKELSGKATIQLIDPNTEKIVAESSQPVTLTAKSTTSVTFPTLPKDQWPSLLIAKCIVSGDGFSDGEQHYLAILPNSEMITKTVPYTQHEPGVKTIDLQQLFPEGTTQQKLTIEYTNNPVWLMVQALAYVGKPYEKSAIDQAASYYSNLLAKSLLAQNPQVKGIFEQWKRETGNETTLHSQLEKNEELKDLVLQETPWVGEASREHEQKQHLADFFDENGIDYRLSTAIEKLQKLQNADGSFSWYPGMEGCTSITVAIEEMLARLQMLTNKWSTFHPSTPSVTSLYDKAFDFIGKEMVELVAKMKKEEKKGIRQTFPCFTALRWLYVCAIDGRQLSAKVTSANEYLIKLLKKDIKNQTIYEKALTAVVLAKKGENTKAKEYVKSLKEYTVYTEEMGRYYDTRRASYSWYDYKIPTEVAAIEAIQQVTPQDQQTIDEMRRWLLQEKRTQSWDTPINSVNAIFAFLNGHSSQLTTSQPATVLAIDGSPIDTSTASAGVGYVKTVVDGSAVNTGRTFTATKTGEGTSWGAVYAQFLQKTAEVENSSSGIKVKREVMIAGEPQSAAISLKVGDRIKVRITIESTRDLDFVQVVDRRAACMEPVRQLSGYQSGAYVSPKDNATHYFYGMMSKGKHVIETEYYIDRSGQYETGTCSVGCAYAPEYRATAKSETLIVKE